MNQSKVNYVIIVGILAIALGAILGVTFVHDMKDKTSESLTQILTMVVSGLLGFLSRGPQGQAGTQETTVKDQ